MQASTVFRSSNEDGPLTTCRPQLCSGLQTNTATWRRVGLNGFQVVERRRPPDDVQGWTVFRSSNEYGPLTTCRAEWFSGRQTNTAPWRRAGLNGFQVVKRTRPPDDVQASTVIRSSNEHGPLTTCRPQRFSGCRTKTAPDDVQASTVFRASKEHAPLTTCRPQRFSGRQTNTAPWRRSDLNGLQVVKQTRPHVDVQASTVFRSSNKHGPLTTCRPQRFSGRRWNTAPWWLAGLNGFQVVDRTRPLTTCRPQRFSDRRTKTAPWRHEGINDFQVFERTRPPDDMQASTVFRSSNEHGPLTTYRPQRFSGRQTNTAPWRRAGLNGFHVVKRTRPPDDVQASTVFRSSNEDGPWRRAGLNGFQVVKPTRPPDDVQTSTVYR